MTLSYHPFAPRPIDSHGVVEGNGHRLKLYSVRYGDAPVEIEAYRDGLELALSALPEAEPEAGRPGLGFVIIHRGVDQDYVVLAWWDRENELPVRVFIRDDGPWRPAGTSESFCVWDLEILYFERNAYLDTVLSGTGKGVAAAYLDRRLNR